MTRVLVGGIGYRNLRDHSFGVLLVDALATEEWPPHVSVEDISYGPIALVQRLEDDPAGERFARAVIVSAVERPDRRPGALSVYRWDNALPDPARIQGAVAEAVTGVIHLDNSLIITRHFEALPADVVIIEVEPAVHAFGEEFSPAVAQVWRRAAGMVRTLALDPAAADCVPVAALGGGALLPDERSAVRIDHVARPG